MIVPLKVMGARALVSNAELRRVFLETAQLRALSIDELAEEVAEAVGWNEHDRRGSTPPAPGATAKGVLVVLGILPGRTGRKREEMKAWRAFQIALLLKSLDERPLAAAA